MTTKDFLQWIEQEKKNNLEAIESAGGTNKWLMAKYTRETGETVFRTFKQWKAEGFSVKKGERSYKVFSKPIKQEKKDKQGNVISERTIFAMAHLFHRGQVEMIVDEKVSAALESAE